MENMYGESGIGGDKREDGDGFPTFIYTGIQRYWYSDSEILIKLRYQKNWA